ncbi:MAG: ABC transporter permease [Saprospiraceae bacterium]|nr:ABC transporter permease [Saprospiraceae bacterium]
MNLAFTIAKRYLLGKKSTNAINLITWISIIGMAIGTAALILILSVFNGFEGILANLLKAYNPDLKVKPEKGSYFELTPEMLSKLRNEKGIANFSVVIEEVALFEYDGSQEAGYIKGVDTNYAKVTDIASTITTGKYILYDDMRNYAVIGNGMFNKLSVNSSDGFTPITAYMPSRGSVGPLSAQFKIQDIHPGGVFSVGGEEDSQYIITDIQVAEQLLGRKNIASSFEIKLNSQSDEQSVRTALNEILGKNIKVLNRYQQDETFLRIMNIEKWISYLIAVLTLGIIAFNLVGSLWMIVLDKKKDIAILRSMGFETKNIKTIFRSIGVLVGLVGMVLGLGIAGFLYFLQKNYDLVAVPDGFLIDAYPIEMKASDLILVFATVISISFLASLLPAARAGKVSAFVRQESYMRMMINRYFLTILGLFIFLGAEAQISGKIQNEKGEPLAYVSVYDSSYRYSAISNEGGYFDLKVPESVHIVYFQLLGYETQIKRFDKDEPTKDLAITLVASSYILPEINVGIAREDPALPIMRKAIKNRVVNSRMVAQYTSKVYGKALVKLVDAPEKVMGKPVADLGRDVGFCSARCSLSFRNGF